MRRDPSVGFSKFLGVRDKLWPAGKDWNLSQPLPLSRVKSVLVPEIEHHQTDRQGDVRRKAFSSLVFQALLRVPRIKLEGVTPALQKGIKLQMPNKQLRKRSVTLFVN
jgi:hypothetical protein